MIIPAVVGALVGNVGGRIEEGRNTRDCKRKCKSWFSTNRELERSCKNACKNDANIRYGTANDFLCSEYGANEEDVIAQFGYDPCLEKGMSVSDYLDPTGEKAAQKQTQQYLIFGGIALVVLLFVAYLIFRK